MSLTQASWAPPPPVPELGAGGPSAGSPLVHGRSAHMVGTPSKAPGRTQSSLRGWCRPPPWGLCSASVTCSRLGGGD